MTESFLKHWSYKVTIFNTFFLPKQDTFHLSEMVPNNIILIE